jgi:hypothetical protein
MFITIKKETTLAKHLSSNNEKAAYDKVCKKLLAHKMILAWIMKRCLKEYKDCDVNDISDKYIERAPYSEQMPVHPNEVLGKINMIVGMNSEDASLTEKNISYDLRFVAIAPKSGEYIKLIINVDAQNDFYSGYPLIK